MAACRSSYTTTFTRRQVIKMLSYSAMATAAPFHPSLQWALGPRRSGDEPRIVREMRSLLEESFRDREMGLYFAYLNDNLDEDYAIQIQDDRLYPMASSFKAAVILYYYLFTPRDEWDDEEGSNLYSTAVYSNNGKTGSVIAEVAERMGKSNPIVAFNDFLIDPDLLGLKYGIYRWTFEEFYTPTNGYSDDRFDPAHLSGEGPVMDRAVNFTTAAEIAQVFRFLAQGEHHKRWATDEHFRAAIQASRTLLSVSIQEFISPLESAIAYMDHYSKEGMLRPVDIGTYVRNDAGVWIMPDTGAYLISFMSATEGDPAVMKVLGDVAEAMRMHQRYLHPNDFNRNTKPSAELYHDGYNYGFVRETGIPLYTEPREDAPRIDNPVRPTSLFGTTYLMYGALVRFMPVDEVWGEIIPDDKWDDAFSWPVYIQLAKLQVVGRTIADPLGNVTGAPEGTSKFIILDIYQRDLIAFEGGTPVLRTPVIINTENTPREISALQRAYVARNMPNYPGVPFTTFLHGNDYLNSNGFALHGSPWHLWGSTVKQSTILRRFTHGCINVPDWEIPMPYLGRMMRPDEFLFRWAGGFQGPGQNLVYMNTLPEPVRILGLDNPSRDIYSYTPFQSMRQLGMNWSELLHLIEEKAIDAPDAYFNS
ncbi:MAG TPA: L,D-transpeptidase [Aggregatilineaceae bacterium]|nr:L,D-transpeptidase [Aggregatilineaceae bacterium]